MSVPFLLPVALALAAPAAQPVPSAAAPEAAAPAPPASPELADPLADPAASPVQASPAQAEPAQARPRHHHTPGDPLEGINRAMFGVNQALDKAFYRPAAMGYKHIVPRPVRTGLRHFFSNIGEPAVFLNYVLQLRIGKAVHTLGRFAINSTVGIGGLIDVAKSRRINLPHRDNGFGDTLAWYGAKPGPYLFVPLLGPTTLRDVTGMPIDDVVVPGVLLSKVAGRLSDSWPILVSGAVIPGLDLRAESDDDLRALTASAVDPYATLRSAWLQNRAAEVASMHAHKATPQTGPEPVDPLHDPAAPSAAPASSPAPGPAAAPPGSAPP